MDRLVPSARVERACLAATASETVASAISATRGLIESMRSGVTGRNRTDTGGTTTHSSAIELRSHLSAPKCGKLVSAAGLLGLTPSAFGPLQSNVLAWPARAKLRPHAPETCALPAALHRDETWVPALSKRCSATELREVCCLAPRHGFEPWTFRLTAGRIYLLSYRGMDSGAGLEPAWACASGFAVRRLRPLGYPEVNEVASTHGVEPRTVGFGVRCSAN